MTDNFLMRHNRKNNRIGPIAGGLGNTTFIEPPTLFERVKVRYRALHKDKEDGSESEALISGDDENIILAQSSKRIQRNSVVTMA